MITFQLSPDVLGNTRFAFSPLGEVTQSLRLLGAPNPTHLHRDWLRRARGSLDGVDVELLLSVVSQGRWIPSSMVPTAVEPGTTIERQLEDLTHLSPDELAKDLGVLWAELGIPRRGQELLDEGVRAPGLLAEAIWDYWDAVIAPHWPRMCAVLESDVSYRLSRLLNDGLFGLMGDIHPDVVLDGDKLHINKPLHADATYTASAMTMVPSIFAWPSVTLEDGTAGIFGLTYPARGVALVWEGLDERTECEGDRLASLLGRTRAAVLGLAAVPMYTTHMAKELGQSAGAVSQHLSVLRDTGLVTSRRSGKSVLYTQTALGASIMAAQATDARARGPMGVSFRA